MFAIWDGIALKRSDIVKPTGLPEEVFTLNASFAANETDLLLHTGVNDNNNNNNKNINKNERKEGGAEDKEEEEEEEEIDIQRVIEVKHRKHRVEA